MVNLNYDNFSVSFTFAGTCQFQKRLQVRTGRSHSGRVMCIRGQSSSRTFAIPTKFSLARAAWCSLIDVYPKSGLLGRRNELIKVRQNRRRNYGGSGATLNKSYLVNFVIQIIINFKFKLKYLPVVLRQRTIYQSKRLNLTLAMSLQPLRYTRY